MLYSGKLGMSEQQEVAPGVWEEVITEHDVVGRIEQRREALGEGGEVLPRITTTTSVTLLARGLGYRSSAGILYLTYGGVRLVATSIVSEHPKIVIYLGEEYHGPLPSGAAGGA